MRIDQSRQSVIMEVEFYRNGDDSIALLGKEPDGSHGLAAQIVGTRGRPHHHPDLYEKLAQILRGQGLE